MSRLFGWLSRRPLWLLQAFGTALGWLGYLLSPSYRRRFDDNVRLAGVAPKDARDAIAHSGRVVTELPYLWLRPPSEPLNVPVHWHGDALIDAAYAQGRGMVILTPHMGCFEITAQAFAQRYHTEHGLLTVLYRPARKAWLRDIVASARNRPGLETAPATLAGVRQMIRALRRGEVVGLLPDQVPPDGLGVWAPFFGQPAYTMTLAARLVQQTGAALLLIWGERLPRGGGYRLHVSTLEEPLPGAEAGQAESAAVVNRAMERLIRQCPQQYLWGYNRYKQPRGSQPGTPSAD